MRVSVKVQPGTYILLAVLILTVPIPWVTAAFFAAYFHELCHICAILLCGAYVRSFEIGASGAKIQTSPLSEFQELLCAAAGPLGSFFLLIFAARIPRIAFCGLIQGLYNLIPIYPLDGGRIFHCIGRRLRTVIRKIPCKDAQQRVQ